MSACACIQVGGRRGKGGLPFVPEGGAGIFLWAGRSGVGLQVGAGRVMPMGQGDTPASPRFSGCRGGWRPALCWAGGG